MRAALIPALLLAVAMPAGAAAQVGQAAAAEAPALARVRALMALSRPHDYMVATNLAAWEASSAQTMAGDPAMQKLELAYPGVMKAAIAAARPAALEFCRKFVNQAIDITSTEVAARLSPAEVEEAVAFFSSAPGKSLVRAMLSSYDIKRMAEEFADAKLKDPDLVLRPEDTRKIDQKAAAGASSKLAADELLAILAFNRRSAAQKLAAASAAADLKIMAIANSPDPAALAAVTDALQAGMLAFVEAKKAK